MVRLQPQPWKVLVALVTRAGQLVPRETLQEAVWGDRLVEADQGLNYCIREIRRVLGDQARSPTYVETVPRRGYRFLAPVEVIPVGGRRGQRPASPTADGSQSTFGARYTWRFRPLTRRLTRPLTRRLRRPQRRIARGGPRARTLLSAAIVVVALALVVWLWVRLAGPGGAPPSRLAVLPFTVESAAVHEEAELIASGLTYEVVTELGRLDRSKIGVLSLDATRRFAQDPRGIRALHEALGSDLVLRGAVRAGEPTTYLHLWLESTEDDRLLWTRRFEADDGGRIATQRSLSEQVTEALGRRLKISLAEPSQRPEDPAERRAYLLGLHRLNAGGFENAQQAAGLFNQAITADPRSARAYAGLSEAILATWVRDQIETEARTAAQRALALDPSSAKAHQNLAWISANYDWDWETAWYHLQRALDLEPNLAPAHGVRSYLLLRRPGNEEEGLAAARRASELDPVSPIVQCDVAWAYLYAGRYEQAVVQAELTLELEPNNFYAGLSRVLALQSLQRRQEAVVAAAALLRQREAPEEVVERLEAAGDLAPLWEWWRQDLEAMIPSGYVPHDGLITTAAQLGENEAALEWLRDSLAARPGFLLFLEVDPRFEPLRSEPEFQRLVAFIEAGGDRVQSSLARAERERIEDPG